jgi:hypothetical protein
LSCADNAGWLRLRRRGSGDVALDQQGFERHQQIEIEFSGIHVIYSY